jgi:hypothetical protein
MYYAVGIPVPFEIIYMLVISRGFPYCQCPAFLGSVSFS